jgi:hypothetical protein
MKVFLATALTAFLLIGSTAVVEFDKEVPSFAVAEDHSEESAQAVNVLTGPAADGSSWQTIDLRAIKGNEKNSLPHYSRQDYLVRLVVFYTVFLTTVFSFTLNRALRNAP